MKRALMILTCALALWGCESKPPATAQTAAGGDTATAPAVAAPAATKVEVAAQGSEFKPAVAKDQIPEGAWICDMGTVHYARMEPGDRKCPLCGMALVQTGAKPAALAASSPASRSAVSCSMVRSPTSGSSCLG